MNQSGPHDSSSYVAAPSSPESSHTPSSAARGVVSIAAVVAAVAIILVGGSLALVRLGGGEGGPEGTPATVGAADAGSAGAAGVEVTDDSGVPTIQVPVTAPMTATLSTTTTPASVPPPTAAASAVLPTTLPTTLPPTTAPPALAPGPAQIGAPTIGATVQRPAGIDACENPITYEAVNAVDDDPNTAWMAPGNGSGQALTFSFPELTTIRQVGMIPGYAKFDPCSSVDRFFQLRRIATVQWSFDDGTMVEQNFTADRSMQLIDIAPVETRNVRVTIVSTLEPGIPDLDNTPISEIAIA